MLQVDFMVQQVASHLHTSGKQTCNQGHQWHSAKGRIFESCITAILHCKIWCLMPSWNFSWLWCVGTYFNRKWSGNFAGWWFHAGISILRWSKLLGSPAQMAFISMICKHWGANIWFSNSLIKMMNNQHIVLFHYLWNIQEECLNLF